MKAFNTITQGLSEARPQGVLESQFKVPLILVRDVRFYGLSSVINNSFLYDGHDLKPGDIIIDTVFALNDLDYGPQTFPGWYKTLPTLDDFITEHQEAIEKVFNRDKRIDAKNQNYKTIARKARFNSLTLTNPVPHNGYLEWSVIGHESVYVRTRIGRENTQAINDFIEKTIGKRLTLYDIKARVEAKSPSECLYLIVKDYKLKSSL